MPRTWLSVFLGFALLAMGLVIFLSLLNSHPSGDRRFIPFVIAPGETFGRVSDRLKADGLVRSREFFYYSGRLTGRSGKMKAGEYELNTHMSASEILEVIIGSSVKLVRVTILEGMTMFQVASRLEEMGLVDKAQFLELCWDPVFLEELMIPSFSVEGYLFPETYYLARGTSARRMIRTFVEMFWAKIDDDDLERARRLNMSIHQAVTMASVIEKETGLTGEMGLISSVFHNRIAKRMRLQSDPTAIYDIMPYGGRVTRDHLFRKTPFNTYQIPGLPLTPVSNPGLMAIRAALNPQQTPYLFFVSRRDGSHHFSATYEEHKKAIDRFLR
jgi:UPF0755 protein